MNSIRGLTRCQIPQGNNGEKNKRHKKIMKNQIKTDSMEQLLSDADKLIQQIHSDVIKEIDENSRLQFDIHCLQLERIKSEMHEKK
ncbi:hypothetical protein JCM14469_30630 [Desulfatiferula olefinivorans]